MRFGGLRCRGLGPFRGEIGVDFDSLPGVLTAVVGGNGAGKSTLLELLGGTVFRTCPTRGSLRDLATERGAWSEVRIVNGAPWTLRQTVDPVSGKSEALILDAEGRPVSATAKVRDADAWVRAHLPPSEVLYASTLGVQGSEGFLAMKPADRKGVLLRILGVEALEAKAATARERGRETKGALAIIEARVGDERQRGGDVEALRAALDSGRRCAATAEDAFARAREVAQKAREAAAMAERRADMEGRLRQLQGRAGALRALLADAPKLRAARAEADQLRAELPSVEADARAARADVGRLNGEVERLRVEMRAIVARGKEREQAAQRARERLSDRERIEAAVRELPAAREAVAEAERARYAAGAERDRLQSQRVAGAEERTVGLRGALTTIANGSAHAPTCARAALDADDEAVRAAKETPRLIREAGARWADAERAVHAARERLGQTERIAARAPTLAEDEHAAEEAEADASRCKAEAQATAERGRAMRTQVDEARELATVASKRVDQIEGRLMLLTPRAAEAERLTVAEAQLAEIDAQIADVTAELGALTVASPVDVGAAEHAVRRAESERGSAERMVATIEADIARAEAAAERVAELEAERARVEADLADWNVLASALGRDGVQADLIDAAGPELTALINDLLHACVSTRWTVSIETTRLDAKGKREIEGLDVRVIDTERGRDALVETYSGGERVLLGEAVSLALTMLACRRLGVEHPTIVRDESGAALDEANARAYVAMLRRASALIGASRVLLVSHAPAVQELCDSRLVVADGRVEVCA